MRLGLWLPFFSVILLALLSLMGRLHLQAGGKIMTTSRTTTLSSKCPEEERLSLSTQGPLPPHAPTLCPLSAHWPELDHFLFLNNFWHRGINERFDQGRLETYLLPQLGTAD